ncbi:MAG: DUF433 domain-containing protein [Nocardioidaceae bacterium]
MQQKRLSRHGGLLGVRVGPVDRAGQPAQDAVPSARATADGEGRPPAVVSVTRIPVSVVLDCLAAGMSAEGIVAEYPTLTVDAVRAAADYGALLARRNCLR